MTEQPKGIKNFKKVINVMKYKFISLIQQKIVILIIYCVYIYIYGNKC